MRFVIVSTVFPPEPVVAARISAQIAEKLFERGHEVTVITSFPNRPEGKIFPGFKRRLFLREMDKSGYEIIRCYSFFSARSTLVSRFLENLSFGVTSGLKTLLIKRPDKIFGGTWPILASGILRFISHIRQIPVIFPVQDLYPESLIIQNRIRSNGLFARFLFYIDKIIMKNCSAIVVISKQFADVYENNRKIDRNTIHIVPNWIDENSLYAKENIYSIRSRYQLSNDAFLCVYGGNIGIAANVQIVIKAFDYLQTCNNIFFLVAGSGSALSSCKKLSQELKLEHILFHSPWLRDESYSVLASADLLILPSGGGQTIVSVPSKLMSYMLSERPILALAKPESEIKKIIDESGCGWVIEPDNPKHLANTIHEISKKPHDELEKKGTAGRTFAIQAFSHDANLLKMIRIFEG